MPGPAPIPASQEAATVAGGVPAIVGLAAAIAGQAPKGVESPTLVGQAIAPSEAPKVEMPRTAEIPAAPPRPAAGPIELSLEPVQLRLTLGQESRLSVRLRNQGNTPERLGVVVEGVPANWIRRSGEALILGPGEERGLELGVLVPSEPANRAGDYPIVVRATSAAIPGAKPATDDDKTALRGAAERTGEQPASPGLSADATVSERWTTLPYTASGRWTVTELVRHSVVLLPEKLRALRVAEYQVRLENEGNTASTFELSAAELAVETKGTETGQADGRPNGKPRDGRMADTLVYTFSQPRVSLEPGQTTEVKLRVKAPTRLVGVEETHPFEVRAKTSEELPPITVKAELVQRALLPIWATLVAALVFAVAAVAILAYSVPGLQPLWLGTREEAVVTPTLGTSQPSPTFFAVVIPTPTIAPASLTATAAAGAGGVGTPTPPTVSPTGAAKDLTPTDTPAATTPTPAFGGLLDDTPTPSSTETPTFEPTAIPIPTSTPTLKPTSTRTNTPCPTPKVVAFSASSGTIIAGQSTTLSWNTTGASNVSIDQGVGGVAASGTRAVSPASSSTYTVTATSCGGTATKTAAVTVQTIPLVNRLSPVSGWVLRVWPRSATFKWSAIGSPAGLKYNIEVEWYNYSTWVSSAKATGLTGTSYTTTSFAGDNPARWRVWATAPGATEGPRGDWWTFSFNTGASQYSGTWLNEDPYTGGVKQIIISNVGQTLYIHPYGACGGGLCDWLTLSVVFNGEPITVSFFSGGHVLTITLDNAAGTRLKVVDKASTYTATYYFHR